MTYRNRQTVRIDANDPAGYTIGTGATTDITELGPSTLFFIRLNSQPEGANTVDLDFVTTDATECLVSPSSFSFDSTNWSADQTITITPQDDLLVDGGQPCAVMMTRNITTTAPEYIAIGNPANVGITVNDNDAPATITILGGNIQSTLVNTAFGVPLTVEVRNGGGQLVQGASVTFTPPGAGASAGITGSPATTNASGQASVTATANTVAGTYNVAVTSGTAPAVNFSLTNTVGVPANMVFVQQPTNALAGNTIAPAVTVSVTDAFGNGVSGQNVTINLNFGTGIMSGTLTQTTDAGGIATFNDLSFNLAGTKDLRATAGILTTVSSNFVISPNVPFLIAFLPQQPTNAVAGATIAPAVTVTIADAFGNAISGQSVTMTLSTGTGVLSGTLTQVTNASGVATFNDLSINLVGSKNLTATSGALSVVSNPFTITVGAPANIAFVQQPTDTAAGVGITPMVSVSVTDAFGNGINGQSVILSLSTGTGALSGTLLNSTDSAGVALFPGISINLIGSKNLTATRGALTAVSNAFTISAGAPANIAFVQQPTDATANATIAPAVTVAVTDSFGNGVVGQNVTINLSTGTGVLAGTLTQATDASGIATFNNLSIDQIGIKNITATSGALNTVSNPFTISVGAPANIAFVQQPTDAVAGTTIAPAVTVSVTDGSGNPVPGQNVTLTLSTGTGVLFGTLTQTTNASGIATFADLSINITGSKNLTATTGALSAISNAFTITADAPANIAFGQQPTDAVSNATIAPAVTVSVTDAFGNGVAGQNVTLNLSNGTGVLAGTLTQVTDGTGVATFADLSINIMGVKNLTATSGALSVVSNVFNISAGAPGIILFLQHPTNAVAGATIAPAVTVIIGDSFGNPVVGQNVTLNLSTGTGVLSGTLTQATNGGGIATFADLSVNLVGSKNITATSGALSAISTAFTISVGTASNIAFAQQPTDAVAGATIAPAVTVSVTDGLGNGVAGQNVTLTLSTGTGILAGTLTQVTDGTGVATFADLSINLAGVKNLTATSGALNMVSNAFTITSGTANNIAFGQQPTDAVAGATIAPAVTAFIIDSFGNPVAGQNITLTLSTGTGVLSGTLTQVTDGAGVATFNDLSINLVGSKNITATSGALTAISNAFNITSGTATNIAFGQQPTDAVAGATIAPAVTVIMTDGLGNGVAGQSVTLTLSTGTGALAGTVTQVTDASGVATFPDLSINLAGSKNLTATSGALNVVSNAFTITSGTSSNIAFVQQPTDAVAGATIAPAVTVTLLDGFSNPIAGQSITISLASGTGVLSGTLTQVTDGAGVATFADLTIDLVGAKTLLATSGALNTTSNIFTISAGAGANLVLVSGTPQQAPTNGIFAAPLVVRVVDAFGNPVMGQTVIFTATVGGGGQSASLSAPLATNIFGETGVTATANGIVGAYTVEASFGAFIIVFSLENLDPNMLAATVACVDANLVVTIISGSGNFDITATYGVGMPLANVPLGAYTFPGPETWLDITVTELGGDLESLLIGNVSCDATTGGGTGTTSVPAPQDPNALGCVLTSEVVAPGAPDNTYCRVLMRDGGVVSYSGAVPQNLIDLGVIFAVDVYRLNGGQAVTEFPAYTQICLSGAGRMFYLDARLSPRDIIEMPTEIVNGMTCAWIPATGTLVLTN
jgi:adhesin/invasin